MAAPRPTATIRLAERAQRDLRGLPTPQLRRIRNATEALARGEANLDVRPLSGRPSWLRLRVGDYRLLYRPLSEDELATLPERPHAGYLVARVVNRRELERAIATL